MNYRTAKRIHAAEIKTWSDARQCGEGSREAKMGSWYQYIEKLENDGEVEDFNVRKWKCPY